MSLRSLASLLLAAALAACASTTRPVLEPQPALADGMCRDEANDLTIDASNDAIEPSPVIWLTERLVGAYESPLVTLAMWPDGHVIYSTGWRDDDLSLREARVAPAEVERLRITMLAKLEGVAPHDQLGWVDPATGKDASYVAHGQATRILIRNGEAWRVAFVWGLGREDVFPSVAAPEPDPEPEPAPEPEPDPDDVDQDGEVINGSEAHQSWTPKLVRKQPSPTFVDAYRTLLLARPTSGRPLVPYTYDLEIYAVEANTPNFSPAAAVRPWPADLPTPPAIPPPGVCALADTGDGGCAYRVPLAHRDAAHRLYTHLQSMKGPRDTFTWGGGTWLIKFYVYLSGLDTIRRVRACARSLYTRELVTSDVF